MFARRQRGSSLSELKIVVVLILILTAISIPVFLWYTRGASRKKVAAQCLTALVSAAGGAADARCPATGKPYSVRPAEGGSEFSCAEPVGHLEPPVTVRRQGDLLSLRQTLPDPPALSEGSFEATSFFVDVEAADTTARARLRNGGGIRWVLGPLLALVFLLGGVTVAWEWFEYRKDGASKLGGILFCVVVSVVALGFTHRVTRIEFDGPKHRMTRAISVWGLPVWPAEVRDGVVGVAALKAGNFSSLAVVWRGPKGVEQEEIVSVAEASIGAAAWFQAVTAGRPR
jgi:type II secretory pathway pseudopilin PulG